MDFIIKSLISPWPWYVSGPLIGLVVPALLIIGNKPFGISSTMRHICAMCFPAKISFFDYNWKSEIWNLVFVSGIAVGALVANTFLVQNQGALLPETTKEMLQSYGIQKPESLLPAEIFSIHNLLNIKGLLFVIFGGFLIGFGTRWGNGCTSGHAITGLSNLQWSSLVATCAFMAGGFFSALVIVPFLLK